MIYLTMVVVLVVFIVIINCLLSNNKKMFIPLLESDFSTKMIQTDSLTKIVESAENNGSTKLNNLIKSTEQPKQEKIIVQFRGSQYDITNFAKKHPGGKIVLVENNGKDIEKLMMENEHSENAYKLLEKYIIK